MGREKRPAFFFFNISQNALRTHQGNFPFCFSADYVCYNKVKFVPKNVVYVSWTCIFSYVLPPTPSAFFRLYLNKDEYVKTLVVMQRAKLTALKINQSQILQQLTRAMNLKYQIHILECCCALECFILCNVVALLLCVKVIEKYLQSTHAPTHSDYTMTVLDIFTVDRKGESNNFLSHLHNR